MKITRREEIRKYIDLKGEVQLSELATIFKGVAEITLRRDLIALEESGFLRRVRGGAVALKRMAIMGDGLYSQRALEHTGAKLHIARLALPYIEVGRSLFLDSGSTVMALAKLLPDEHCPIMTSGANIALELVANPKYAVTTVGGLVNHNTLAINGDIALVAVRAVNIDIAVMSSSGFALGAGFTASSFTECELKRAVVERARRVLMLLDNSKWGRSMPFSFAQLADVDVLVTDERPTPQLEQACEEHGVELVF